MFNVIKVKLSAEIVSKDGEFGEFPGLIMGDQSKYKDFDKDDNDDLRNLVCALCDNAILIIPKESTSIFFKGASKLRRDDISQVEKVYNVHIISMEVLENNKSLLIHKLIMMKTKYKDSPIIVWGDYSSDTSFFGKFGDLFNIYTTTKITKVVGGKGYGDRFNDGNLWVDTHISDYSKI